MAKAKDNQKETKVTRVKAKDLPAEQGKRGDSKVTKKAAAPKKAVAKKPVVLGDDGEPKKGIFKKFIGYFAGAWYELKQVRWPTRKATWGMTGALLVFTGVFIGFIVVIDLLWENLFKLIFN